MKVLITSVDAVFDYETQSFFPGIKEALQTFESMDEGNTVIIISIQKSKLTAIGKDFRRSLIPRYLRQSAELIPFIEEKEGIEHSDLIVLGAKMGDVIMAANAKALLLTALWAQSNNPTDLIYTKGYGEPVKNAQALSTFFQYFLNKTAPWYYHLKVSDSTELYALTNANTYYQSNDVVAMNEKFKAYLKNGVDRYKDLFRTYFVVSTYYIFKELKNVNYWGVYPSSGIGPNEDLEYFKEHARKLYKSRSTQPILIRQVATQKRHLLSSTQREEDGCKDQLETITINPYYRSKLAGSTVCIIDDFTTLGTSCETARHLLEAAGVEKLIFITMGKFGKDYFRYDYTLNPLPQGLYSGLTSTLVSQEPLYGAFNKSANMEMLDSLSDLL